MESFDPSLTRFLENENANVFVCDASLRILAVGPHLASESEGFLPGRSLDELFPAQSRELAEARQKLSEGAPFFSTKFEYLPYSSTVCLLPIPDGGRPSLILGCLDPSVNPETMDGLSAVLPGLSDQYRSPLSSLLNILSSMAIQCQQREDYHFLDFLNEAARYCYQMLRGSTMTHDYFVLVNGRVTPDRKKLLLNGFLEELCTTLRHHLAAVEYKLELQTPGEPVIVEADERLLTRALYHLIANACVYSPRESTITITLTAFENTASISVADEGVGIEQTDYERIFQPFYVKRDIPCPEEEMGVGLGLPIAREIVRLHEGRVLVTSELNQGTTFAVSLPRANADKAELSLHSDQRRYANDRFSDLFILFYGICEMKLY